MIIFIGFLILLIVPLTSAGFFSDFWGKITGKATKGVSLNITVGIPSIVSVYNATMIPNPASTLNAGPFPTGFVINFTVYHGAGSSQLNYSTATANFSKSGETTRTNASCFADSAGASTYYMNFTCNVTMFWYDVNGTWNIGTFILDNNTNYASNNTQTFQLTLTTGFDMSPNNLTWPAFGPGSINQTSSNDPLTLNNTGNKAIGGAPGGSSNISVNATHLTGETTSSWRIFANNFSLSWDGNTGTCSGAAGNCMECDTSAGRATNMSFATFANVTTTNLTRGNFTIRNNYTGQEQLFLCIKVVDTALTSQAYSTLGNGSWIVQI